MCQNWKATEISKTHIGLKKVSILNVRLAKTCRVEISRKSFAPAFAPAPINCENRSRRGLYSQGGMERWPGRVSKLFPLGQKQSEPWVKQLLCNSQEQIMSWRQQSREVGSFCAMRKPKLTILRNGEELVDPWASRGCRKNKQGHTQTAGWPIDPLASLH